MHRVRSTAPACPTPTSPLLPGPCTDTQGGKVLCHCPVLTQHKRFGASPIPHNALSFKAHHAPPTSRHITHSTLTIPHHPSTARIPHASQTILPPLPEYLTHYKSITAINIYPSITYQYMIPCPSARILRNRIPQSYTMISTPPCQKHVFQTRSMLLLNYV